MFPYERFDQANDPEMAIALADDILANGWVHGKSPIVRLLPPIVWFYDQPGLRTFNYLLNAFALLDAVLTAHSHTNETKYLSPAVSIAISWIACNAKASKKDNPFAWYDMAVAYRAYRLAYIYEAAEKAGILGEDDKQTMWLSILQHARWLADDANISWSGNHGFYQAAGQIIMSRRFASHPLLAESFAQGQNRLKKLIEQHFTEEGIHKEHSPDYHRMVYESIKSFIKAGIIEDKAIKGMADKMETALASFVYPNGRLVNFGDSDHRDMRASPLEAEKRWNTDQMRFWATGGQAGKPSATGCRAFPKSGYWVVQAANKDPQDARSYSYLALSAAFHSPAHKHADDLNFVWFDRGRPILVDAGWYGYKGLQPAGSPLWNEGFWYSDPMRIYCESTHAHNCLEFDGRSYQRKQTMPYASALQRYGEANGIMFAESSCRQFGMIDHSRILFFKPGKWLLVFDHFCDQSAEVHDVRQWYHLAEDIDAQRHNSQYCLDFAKQKIRVASLVFAATASPVYQGEKGSMFQGWFSATEDHAVPNPAFCFCQKACSAGSFATIFSFTNTLKTPETAMINTSGTKAAMAWTDDEGKHRLQFDRSTSTTIATSYHVSHPGNPDCE